VTVDRFESLDWAERWFSDAFAVLGQPGGMALIDVDMTESRKILESLKGSGVAATYGHFIVRAVAMALSRHPDLHTMVAGTSRLFPGQVDIGFSVAGQTCFAPPMILKDAGNKPLAALSTEITRRVPEIREKEAKDLTWMRKWGFIIPFGFLRRAMLRLFLRFVWFRRNLAGTFQVSSLPGVDVVVPFLFNTAAVYGAGRVRDRVVAVDGKPEVRPIITLSVCIDHRIWDGARAARFHQEVKSILESGELAKEVTA
jgi:pyruvate dehydrogenase E2 component (dihydrolipoamide acetyltransferase)